MELSWRADGAQPADFEGLCIDGRRAVGFFVITSNRPYIAHAWGAAEVREFDVLGEAKAWVESVYLFIKEI